VKRLTVFFAQAITAWIFEVAVKNQHFLPGQFSESARQHTQIHALSSNHTTPWQQSLLFNGMNIQFVLMSKYSVCRVAFIALLVIVATIMVELCLLPIPFWITKTGRMPPCSLPCTDSQTYFIKPENKFSMAI